MLDVENFEFPEGHKDEFPVMISFFWHDLEDIGDGDDTLPFWIPKEEYLKVVEYYKKPNAHFIGTMVHFNMSKIQAIVEKEVSHFAKDIYISQIRPYDPEIDDWDWDEEDGVWYPAEYDD